MLFINKNLASLQNYAPFCGVLSNKVPVKSIEVCGCEVPNYETVKEVPTHMSSGAPCAAFATDF